MATFALHFSGAVILMGLVVWQPLTAGPCAFIWAWLREQSYEWGQTRERRKAFKDAPYELAKPTFLDTWWHWQTKHKLWEATQWGIGGQLVGILGHIYA